MIVRLNEYGKDLSRGKVLRCKGSYPYEESVDFMIVELPDEKENYALMVISGYKAGLVYSRLPGESIPAGNDGYALGLDWLKSNWSKWGYFGCS